MITFLFRCRRIINKYIADEMTVYAAQASFFIIIAAFPFIMLLLSIIQLVPSISQEDLLELLAALVPIHFQEIIASIVNSLYTKSPGTLLSLSVVAALWSASKGMMSMARGLNRVQESHIRRGYLVNRIICSGYTIVFIIVCILSLVLLVFGDAIQEFVIRLFPIFADITQYIINVRTLLSLGTLVFCFTGLYTVLPDEKLSWRSQIPGAIFSTLCWIGISLAFSIYFRFFDQFSYTYGSLTAVVLLMLWLYICICALFLGAEINYFYEKEYGKGPERQ